VPELPAPSQFLPVSAEQKEALLGGNLNDGQRKVDGEVFIRPIDLPLVPARPTSLNGKAPGAITSSLTLKGGGELPTTGSLSNR